VKSLSKGNNLKKDVLSSTTNLKESTTLPLPSVASNASNFEEDITTSWPEQTGGDDYDVSEEFYEPERTQWKRNNVKLESLNRAAPEEKLQKPSFAQTKWKDQQRSDANNSHFGDDLDALLQVSVL